jgi:hypothetical protein
LERHRDELDEQQPWLAVHPDHLGTPRRITDGGQNGKRLVQRR